MKKRLETGRLVYSDHELKIQAKVFSLYEKTVTDPLTNEGRRFLSIRSSDWVLVILVTEDEDVILIEQDRAGVEKMILEFPGGMIENDETPLEAAKKECLEETGYQSSQWIALGSFWSNPAFLDNKVHYFLGINAKKVQEQNLETHEVIRLKVTPLPQVIELIQKNSFESALSCLGFFLAMDAYQREKKV
jgi:ADP-ribose pyrophosphatase